MINKNNRFRETGSQTSVARLANWLVSSSKPNSNCRFQIVYLFKVSSFFILVSKLSYLINKMQRFVLGTAKGMWWNSCPGNIFKELYPFTWCNRVCNYTYS